MPLLLALALTLSFTGCHGTLSSGENPAASSSYPVPDEFDTSRRYEVTFWAKNDTNMAQVNIYKQAIADFEALYPNITVNLRLYTDYGKIYNDVITNIATDTTPNVCITYPDHIATYLTGEDTVVPLDDLFADEKYGLGGSEVRFDSPTQAEIIPQFLSECAINGHYYAIPYMRSTEACYVNKTYVEKLGYTLPDVLTWDFVWEVSEAAMAKDSAGNFLLNGQKVLIPFIDKSTDNMMIQMLKQQGAGYSTSSGEVQLFNDTTGEILTTIAEHAASGAFNTFKLAGYPANFLNAGQCIFAIDSTAGATWMGADAPLIDIAEEKLIPFELAVLPVPQFDPEQPQMISQGPSVCVFNKSDPQEVLASWLFAQYLLTNDVQIAYSQTEGYIPVTSKAQESPAYQDYLSRCGEDNDHPLPRQDRGRPAADALHGLHLRYPRVQRLRVSAQRRRAADRGREQVRAPPPDGQRQVPFVSLQRRFLPVPLGPDSGVCQRLRAAARRFQGAADRSCGLLGRDGYLCSQ